MGLFLDIKSQHSAGVNSYSSVSSNIVHFTALNRALSQRRIVKFVDGLSRDSLELHVKTLSSAEMEGRAVGSKGINLARDYISNKFDEIGLKPVKKLGLKSYLQDYNTESYVSHLDDDKISGFVLSDKHNSVITSNLLGMIKGKRYPNDFVIITAHYDHLGKTSDGKVFPGADDNASSVSALIEIARGLKKTGTKRSVIFAALSGEEAHLTGVNTLMQSLKDNNLKNKVQIIDIEMLGAKGGNKLDILKYKPSLSQNMVENMKNACEAIGSKFHVMRPDPNLLNQAEKFSRFNFPAVCLTWDFKAKSAHPHYHQYSDTFENMNKDVFEKAAKSVAAITYYETHSRPPITSKPKNIITRIKNLFKSKNKVA